MIFVTLGTQDKTFERLLIKIDELIEKKVIDEEVIVQAGKTVYTSKHMEIFDFKEMDEINKYVESCSYMITHAGVGTIMNGLSHHKKIIAVARRAQFKEHENDHQVEITKKFSDLGLILGCLDVDELENAVNKVNDFQPNEYHSNQLSFCRLIEEMIEK